MCFTSSHGRGKLIKSTRLRSSGSISVAQDHLVKKNITNTATIIQYMITHKAVSYLHYALFRSAKAAEKPNSSENAASDENTEYEYSDDNDSVNLDNLSFSNDEEEEPQAIQNNCASQPCVCKKKRSRGETVIFIIECSCSSLLNLSSVCM